MLNPNKTIGDRIAYYAEIGKRLKEFNKKYLKDNDGSYRNLFERMYPDIKVKK